MDNSSVESEPMSLSGSNNCIQSSQEEIYINNLHTKRSGQNGELRSVEEIAPMYRHIFPFQYFNIVQSRVLNDALYSDKSIVVAAPTGSGKTVVFELAMIRLLTILGDINYKGDFKIVYMAPIKALCTEKLMEWHSKFSRLGLLSIEVTGDTEVEFVQLKPYKIILTTPEKWDMMTRRWRDHKEMVHLIKLFMIDEVHILNDSQRGPVLEAVVSRMKTIQASVQSEHRIAEAKRKVQEKYQPIFSCSDNPEFLMNDIRFVAVSATAVNTEDVAIWLGDENKPAIYHKIDDDLRPVKLKKVVEAFHCPDGMGPFKFDLMLNYKIWPIIEKYYDGKPTLIFCNSRKSVIMTAEALSCELTFKFNNEQIHKLTMLASQLIDKKLKKLALSGIGCHHAGFVHHERHLIEQIFRDGDLPILVTTTTLAMGVNLPAHLVIIKNTQNYISGSVQDYSESTILQMMGRAGRPQFDTEGTAVIMTKSQDRTRYMGMLSGGEPLESSLHVRLFEHVNSEAALGTLSDLAVAVQWARSTFLYVRAMRAPRRYLNLPQDAPRHHVEKKIEELCLKAMNALARAGMLTLDEAFCVQSTEAGKLMAIYCLDFETMKLIMQIKGTETLNEILQLVCSCHELSDIPLRMGEKRCLNMLNRSKDSETIKYPIKGRITSKEMKVNCMIQAVLGCIPIHDPSLNQESLKIKRIACRIAKCIEAYLTRNSFTKGCPPFFTAILNSLLLSQCLEAGLWNDSKFVSRQMKGIGATLMTLLASAGKTSFKSIYESNPRDLERIMNKAPPAGNILKQQVSYLPFYSLKIEKLDGQRVEVTLTLENYDELSLSHEMTAGDHHKFNLIVGDSKNNLLHFSRHRDVELIEEYGGKLRQTIKLKTPRDNTVYAHYISANWVGLNAECSFNDGESTPRTGIKRFLKTYDTQTKNETENKAHTKNSRSKFTDVISNSQESTSLTLTGHSPANPKKKVKSKRIDEMFKEQKKRSFTNTKSKSPHKKVKLSKADNIIKDCIQMMMVVNEDGANLKHEEYERPTKAAAQNSQNRNILSSVDNKQALNRFAYTARICEDKIEHTVDKKNDSYLKFDENALQHKSNDVWTGISSSYDDWLKTLNVGNIANEYNPDEYNVLTEIEKEMQQKYLLGNSIQISDNILTNNPKKKNVLADSSAFNAKLPNIDIISVPHTKCDNFQQKSDETEKKTCFNNNSTERQIHGSQYVQGICNIEGLCKSITEVNQNECNIKNSVVIPDSQFNNTFNYYSNNSYLASDTQFVSTSNRPNSKNSTVKNYSQSSSLVDDDLILFNETMQEIIPKHKMFNGNLQGDEYDDNTSLFKGTMASMVSQENCSGISGKTENKTHLTNEFNLGERLLLWKNGTDYSDREISNARQPLDNNGNRNTYSGITMLQESEYSDDMLEKTNSLKFDKHFDLSQILGNDPLSSSSNMSLDEYEKINLNELDKSIIPSNFEKQSHENIVESTRHNRKFTQFFPQEITLNRGHTISGFKPNNIDLTSNACNERKSDFVTAKYMVEANDVSQIYPVNCKVADDVKDSSCEKNNDDRVKYLNSFQQPEQSKCSVNKKYIALSEDSHSESQNKDKSIQHVKVPLHMENSINTMQTYNISRTMSDSKSVQQDINRVCNDPETGPSISVSNILNNLPAINICNETSDYNFSVSLLSPKFHVAENLMKMVNDETIIVNEIKHDAAKFTQDESNTKCFVSRNTRGFIQKNMDSDTETNIVSKSNLSAVKFAPDENCTDNFLMRNTADFTQSHNISSETKTNIENKTNIARKTDMYVAINTPDESNKENSVSRSPTIFAQNSSTSSPPSSHHHSIENNENEKSNYNIDTEFEIKITKLHVIGKQTGRQFSMSVKSCSKKVSWRHPLTSNATSEGINIQSSAGDLSESVILNLNAGPINTESNIDSSNNSPENEIHNIFKENGKILENVVLDSVTVEHENNKIVEISTETDHRLVNDSEVVSSNIKDNFENKKPHKECSKINSEKVVSAWLNKLTSDSKTNPEDEKYFCNEDFVQSEENTEKSLKESSPGENDKTLENRFLPHKSTFSYPIKNMDFRLKLSKILQENNLTHKKANVSGKLDDKFDLGAEELFESFMKDDDTECILEDNHNKIFFKKPLRQKMESIKNIEHLSAANIFVKFKDNNRDNTHENDDDRFSFDHYENPCDKSNEEIFSQNNNDDISENTEFPIIFCDYSSQASNESFDDILYCDDTQIHMYKDNHIMDDRICNLLNPQVVLESAYGSRDSMVGNIDEPSFKSLHSSHSKLLHTMADEVMCDGSIHQFNEDGFHNSDEENISHWDKFMTGEDDSMDHEILTTITDEENENLGKYDCLVPSSSTCEFIDYEPSCEKYHKNIVNRYEELGKFQEIEYNSMRGTLFVNENHSPKLNEAFSAETEDSNNFSSPIQRLRKFQLVAKDKMSSENKSACQAVIPQTPQKFVTSKMQHYLNAMKKFY